MTTDAHCHLVRDDARHFLCEPLAEGTAAGPADLIFRGIHPWLVDAAPADALETLRARLREEPRTGVGEIGLDRLRERNISSAMRALFEAQLALAAEFGRPVVLHGAKCWGEVVKTIESGTWRTGAGADRIPGFLFHGFSRSGGLLPAIVALNGYVSVGPAILNDHAVNYRELAKAIPSDRLLVESDATAETADGLAPVGDLVAKLAALRGCSADALSAVLEANADRFADML